MRFGAVATQAALGAILAHSTVLAQGRLRKGTVLTQADITALLAAGIKQITVAQLDDQDVHEDVAADRLAQAVGADVAGLRLSVATTGRVNVVATAAGLFHCDVDAIMAVNAVNPMITIATLPQYQRVAAGDMVATIKIISYGVHERDIVKAVAAALPLALLPAQHRHVTLIETQTTSVKPTSKGRTAMAARLERLGCQLTSRVVVPHEEEPLARAITTASGTMVLILTGSATSDLYDVAPQALRLAGGQVARFGMPVDPGNLLFIGACAAKSVIGLPGCARSLALNGADWVLERMLCGVTVADAEIAAMGVGGLLKESPARHHPRRR